METFQHILIEWGYWGIFVSAAVAGSILPFSSEAVLVALLGMGLDPVGLLIAATAGNTLGGMTCYALGMLGNRNHIRRLGISEEKLARAERFLAGRGAAMAFFAFLPVIGSAIAVVLGMLRSNRWIVVPAMALGKLLRYGVLIFIARGIFAVL